MPVSHEEIHDGIHWYVVRDWSPEYGHICYAEPFAGSVGQNFNSRYYAWKHVVFRDVCRVKRDNSAS